MQELKAGTGVYILHSSNRMWMADGVRDERALTDTPVSQVSSKMGLARQC